MKSDNSSSVVASVIRNLAAGGAWAAWMICSGVTFGGRVSSPLALASPTNRSFSFASGSVANGCSGGFGFGGTVSSAISVQRIVPLPHNRLFIKTAAGGEGSAANRFDTVWEWSALTVLHGRKRIVCYG
jgi:hypothetical protein